MSKEPQTTLLMLAVLLILSGCAGKYVCGECDDNNMTPCWLDGRCGNE